MMKPVSHPMRLLDFVLFNVYNSMIAMIIFFSIAELKQAMVSMMLRKDEIEEQNRCVYSERNACRTRVNMELSI